MEVGGAELSVVDFLKQCSFHLYLLQDERKRNKVCVREVAEVRERELCIHQMLAQARWLACVTLVG